MTKEAYLELALAKIDTKLWKAALDALHQIHPPHALPSPDVMAPRFLSALGLCMAMAENKVHWGTLFCKQALEREPYLPHFYHYLGMVYLKAGKKQDAISIFEQGLNLDESHQGILSELCLLGFRKEKSLSYLPRKNVLNKVLGKLSN